MSIYLDHNATTPVHPDVCRAIEPYFSTHYGNASCLYRLGVDASYAVEKARAQVARLIGARYDEIVFTSGGTEADNLAIKGVVLATGKKHIITTAIEHPAVKQTCEFLERYLNCRVTYLPVDSDGRVCPRDVTRTITNDTALVSIMAANNETGSIQPIEEIGHICRENYSPFHTDAVQAAGRMPLQVEDLVIDLLSMSSHKMYGPKGVGALYIREGVPIVPIMHGGSHEQGRRAGTENVSGIVGFGKAAELARNEMAQRSEHETGLREYFWQKIHSIDFPFLRNSPIEKCLPGTINLSIPGINAREFVRAMDQEGFCIATGSACSTGKSTPSYVIKALGRSNEEANSSIRISFGISNATSHIDQLIERMKQVLTGTEFLANQVVPNDQGQ